MDQDPRPIETERAQAAKIENRDEELESGLEKLEQPPQGNFIAGLRNFVQWVKELLGK